MAKIKYRRSLSFLRNCKSMIPYIIYSELQLGMPNAEHQRNQRYMHTRARARLGLQTSPENFFYGEDRICWRALRQPATLWSSPLLSW